MVILPTVLRIFDELSKRTTRKPKLRKADAEMGLDPREGEEGRGLGEQEMCLWRRLSQLKMHQKMGEERRNDEENECKGIRMRGEGGIWGTLAGVRPPQLPYLRTCDNPAKRIVLGSFSSYLP